MPSSKWRLYETFIDDGKPCQRLMRKELEFGIGGVVNTTYIKRRITREAIGNRYFRAMYSSTKERVPEGVEMGRWKERSHIAQSLGCAFFFIKESKDKRYVLELEVNYADE